MVFGTLSEAVVSGTLSEAVVFGTSALVGDPLLLVLWFELLSKN